MEERTKKVVFSGKEVGSGHDWREQQRKKEDLEMKRGIKRKGKVCFLKLELFFCDVDMICEVNDEKNLNNQLN